MDMAQLQRLTDWVTDELGERVSTSEVVEKADAAPLPQEAKRVVRDLPDREWSREELLGALQDLAHERYGAGVSATESSKEGGGGIFGE